MRYGMHVYNNYIHIPIYIYTGKMEKTGFVSSVHLLKFLTKYKKKQYVPTRVNAKKTHTLHKTHKECEKET